MYTITEAGSGKGKKYEKADYSHFEIQQTINNSSLHTKVVATGIGFDELESSWNQIWELTDCYVFQTFDWNRSWWEHFGEFGELQIFVLYDGETLVGIAPLFYDSYSLLGWENHVSLRFIGSHIHKTAEGLLLGDKAYSDYLQFIIQEEYIQSFFHHLMKFLKESRFDDLVLEEIPEQSSTLNIQNLNLAAHGLMSQTTNASATPYIKPAASWETYLADLDVKQRYNTRRSLKNINDDEYRLFYLKKLSPDEDVEPGRNRFIKMHQQHWNNQGLPGTFAENCMLDFFKDITDKLHQKGKLRMYMLYHKENISLDQCLGIDIMIACRGRMYGLHRAVDSASPHYKKAPGKSLLVATILEAVKNRCTFDFLRGEESYKLRLASKVNQNKTIVITSVHAHQNVLTRFLFFMRKMKQSLILERRKKRIISRHNTYYSTGYGYLKFLLNRVNKRIRRK